MNKGDTFISLCFEAGFVIQWWESEPNRNFQDSDTQLENADSMRENVRQYRDSQGNTGRLISLTYITAPLSDGMLSN